MSSKNNVLSAEIVSALTGCDRGYELLCWTIEMGDVEKALHLIAIGAEVKQQQQQHILHHTPLHLAVLLSSHALVSLLISKGSDVNARGHNNITPLHLAKSAEITKLLLNNGASISMDVLTSNEGYTPLHQAIVFRQLAVVEVLLERGADVNDPGINGLTALSLAFSTKCSFLVELVLKYNPDVRIPNITDRLKKEESNEESAIALINFRIGLNTSDTNEFLRGAAHRGYWNIVEQLLKLDGGGCPKTNEFVLYRSINANKPHVTEIILSREVDINVVHNGNDDDNSVLSAAVVSCLDIEIIKKLIAKGADLNRKNSDGKTIMHFVGDPKNNLMNVSNKVVDASRAKIAELLISLGADVNSMANRKHTPLHFAASEHYPTVVEVLLKANADVNAKDAYGETPLFSVSMKCNVKVAEILLSNGADTTVVNNKQKTVLDDICKDYEFYDLTKPEAKIAKLLISHGTLMEAQQLNVSDVTDVWLNDCETIGEFRSACENELAKLKIENIGIPFISFYNVLTKREVWFAKYLANKKITKKFKSGVINKKFPIYKGFVKKKLMNGLARKDLIDKVRRNPLYFFRLLPEICFQKIRDYLNGSDLKRLVEASCTMNQ